MKFQNPSFNFFLNGRTNERTSRKQYAPHFFKVGGIMSCIMRRPAFAYAKAKAQIRCTVTAQLIGAFVFATQIVSCYLLNLKFQASSHLL